MTSSLLLVVQFGVLVLRWISWVFRMIWELFICVQGRGKPRVLLHQPLSFPLGMLSKFSLWLWTPRSKNISLMTLHSVFIYNTVNNCHFWRKIIELSDLDLKYKPLCKAIFLSLLKDQQPVKHLTDLSGALHCWEAYASFRVLWEVQPSGSRRISQTQI